MPPSSFSCRTPRTLRPMPTGPSTGRTQVYTGIRAARTDVVNMPSFPGNNQDFTRSTLDLQHPMPGTSSYLAGAAGLKGGGLRSGSSASESRPEGLVFRAVASSGSG